MREEFSILTILEYQGFSKIDIDQIVNYLETLDYDLKKIASSNPKNMQYNECSRQVSPSMQLSPAP